MGSQLPYHIRARGGPVSWWETADPILKDREIGVETDTGRMKVGDGATVWSSLAYFTPLLKSYTVAGGLPTAADHKKREIWVEDEVGGPTPAWSNGTNWLRYSDGSIVS